MIEWLAAEKYHPDPLDLIRIQIANIGMVICNALGHKVTAQQLLFDPAAVSPRGRDPHQMEKELIMWGRHEQRKQQRYLEARGIKVKQPDGKE